MEDAAAPHVQAAYRYLSRDRPRAVPAVCVCVNVNVSVIYRSQLSTQSVSQSHSHINPVPLCGSRTFALLSVLCGSCLGSTRSACTRGFEYTVAVAQSVVSVMFSYLKKLTSGFDAEKIVFEGTGITVATTRQLAEGGYSYVYAAKEVSGARQFAVKKVLAQDADTRQIAEMEMRVLQQLAGHRGFVQMYGTMNRPSPTVRNATEYWMLLEMCPNGSLIDLLYQKGKSGAFDKREPLPILRVLAIFEEAVASIAHMHALSPPVTHRDLKLENVLGTADGRYVLCDFGSAVTTKLSATRTRKEAAIEEERIHKYSTLM